MAVPLRGFFKLGQHGEARRTNRTRKKLDFSTHLLNRIFD